jgi:hypothetical protein
MYSQNESYATEQCMLVRGGRIAKQSAPNELSRQDSRARRRKVRRPIAGHLSAVFRHTGPRTLSIGRAQDELRERTRKSNSQKSPLDQHVD